MYFDINQIWYVDCRLFQGGGIFWGEGVFFYESGFQRGFGCELFVVNIFVSGERVSILVLEGDFGEVSLFW